MTAAPPRMTMQSDAKVIAMIEELASPSIRRLLDENHLALDEDLTQADQDALRARLLEEYTAGNIDGAFIVMAFDDEPDDVDSDGCANL